MQLEYNFRDLGGGELSQIIGTWVQLIHGWLEVRHTLWNIYGFEIMHTWNMHSICWTWMEVRCYLDVGDMQIIEPGLRWDSTRMKRRRESRSLDGYETQISETWMGLKMDLDWVETHNLRPGYGEMGLWWRWDTILATWMAVIGY